MHALVRIAGLAALLAAALPAQAQRRPAPKLIVAISVDQFGANLFERYRARFTGGMARLLGGTVFSSGYQSHALTETCLGHSTILTGDRPARTGIIGNDWYAAAAPRADKKVYCAEDGTAPGSSYEHPVISPAHLRVPTLGDRMKAANPASRVVSVAGKDRSAVMMGGHAADQTWWWRGRGFESYIGRAAPPVVTRANAAIGQAIATAQAPLTAPPECAAVDRPVAAGTATVGAGRFARAAGDAAAFRVSPQFEGAVLALAAGFVQDLRLGRGPAPDLLAIGLSATDTIGHAYGNGGLEMCLQMLALDRSLRDFFAVLDREGVDYEVVLTADHGAADIPERAGGARVRTSPALSTAAVGDAVAQALGLAANPLHSVFSIGDVWVDPALTGAVRQRVIAETVRRYRALPEVAEVLTRERISATPAATAPPDRWTLAEKARAGFDGERSGDLIVLVRDGVMPLTRPTPERVLGHGIPWPSDQRVPILFWRRGMAHTEPSDAIETVDIMPTLAATIGLPIAVGDVDGRCLAAVARCP